MAKLLTGFLELVALDVVSKFHQTVTVNFEMQEINQSTLMLVNVSSSLWQIKIFSRQSISTLYHSLDRSY